MTKFWLIATRTCRRTLADFTNSKTHTEWTFTKMKITNKKFLKKLVSCRQLIQIMGPKNRLLSTLSWTWKKWKISTIIWVCTPSLFRGRLISLLMMIWKGSKILICFNKKAWKTNLRNSKLFKAAVLELISLILQIQFRKTIRN